MKKNNTKNLLKIIQSFFLRATYLSSAGILTKTNHFENTSTYLKFVLNELFCGLFRKNFM